LMTPDLSLAQHHGGGGGGREGGGSHAGGGWNGGSHAGGAWGGGGSWQNGANGWRGGYGGYGYGGRGYGYGSYGWGYPDYGYNNWNPQYYGPGAESTFGYANQPDYYSNEATPEYADFASGPGNRTYGNLATEDINAVRFNVRVPANAEVMFEGEKTTQTGAMRQYISPPLTPGGNYTYDIRASWMENGRQVSRTRHVPVRAGEVVRVDFLRRESSDEATEGVTPPRGSTSTDRRNLPVTTSPDTTYAPRTPPTPTSPVERGTLPGTPPPAGGSNPRPMPPN